ncbi:Coenzyme F390 synthetase [Paramagnetospirillum magnetotacticum MS-1]|uniref:Coenzyme F390 synthetase n=1 Tax=Paramagnetospirillum magnetotacticum MS-1 TaxID=272627 RepID=A0A0C2U8D3_PARME|nr:AMP-binding protein [Paramagnetospirillum magnetotacticum]KIL97762.1 Coenzyme F390 synthetase [Paramagnetospirillum magnetotacticum MS-1]
MQWFENPLFSERVEFLESSQYWPAERHAVYQLRSLRRLVHHVAAHVPFYRDFMAASGIRPEDILSIEDIKRFPIIDKKVIQAQPEAFLADGSDRATLLHRTTGGSTGTPLTVWFDGDLLARDKANTEHYMRAIGLDIFTWKSIRLYGDKIDPEITDTGRYWKLVDGRRLVMSCYHITHETAPAYVAELNRFRPRYIHTRPSSILPLAKYILQDGLALDPIRTIVSDGEYLTDGQRAVIERAFQGRLYNIYGHTEACVVGHPCHHSDGLHLMPQVGVTELLDEQGRDVTEPGGRGELVVTGFNNPVMPLIRYRTGDVAYLGEGGCRCGRHYQMLKGIEGRLQDYVIDAAGNPTPLAPAVFNYNDMDWKGIKEFKVIQDTPGELTILIVLEAELAADPAGSKAVLEQRIGAILAGFRISITLVDDIPKTKIGKHRYLDQRLDVKELVSFR